MDNMTLCKSIDYICNKAKSMQNDILNVVLHGGEPMLYDIGKI